MKRTNSFLKNDGETTQFNQKQLSSNIASTFFAVGKCLTPRWHMRLKNFLTRVCSSIHFSQNISRNERKQISVDSFVSYGCWTPLTFSLRLQRANINDLLLWPSYHFLVTFLEEEHRRYFLAYRGSHRCVMYL